MAAEYGSLDVRPYQLVCCVCRAGRRGGDEYYFDRRLDEIAGAVWGEPAVPLTLRCNVEGTYSYQNPGRQFDTPEGEPFNDKRDLDILHALGLVPGATRPAYELFKRLFADMPTCRGICGYEEVTCETWRGCRLANSGNYERGHALGVEAIIPPRSDSEKAAAKRRSCAEMSEAEALCIRPHHLMCMTCFHGGKEHLEPIEEDNLFEAIKLVQVNAEKPITLIAGPCMICPPCSGYDAASNRCVGGIGTGLRDQKKDLDVLQVLGMDYGDTLPAREMFQRLYERVRSTRQVCGYGDGIVRGPEWTVCGGPEGAQSYTAGRAAGLGIEGVEADMDGI